MVIPFKWNKKNSSCAGADDDEKCYCQNEKNITDDSEWFV